jgi:glycosyltransferase involved in cell wall biosynthesis
VGEVILDGKTGYVLPLDAGVWAEHAMRLLSQPDLYKQISEAGFRHVQKYTYGAAAAGLIDAFKYCLEH